MLVVVRGLGVRRAAEVGMRVVVRRLGGPVGMRRVAGRVRLVVRVLVPVRMDMRVAVRMAVHQVAMPVLWSWSWTCSCWWSCSWLWGFTGVYLVFIAAPSDIAGGEAQRGRFLSARVA